MRRYKRLLFLWLLVLTTIGAQADMIKGKVIDTQSGTPLSDVSVEAVVHTGSFTITQNSVTDSLGQFSIDFFVTGHASLSFSFLGYKTVHKAQYVFSRDEGNDTIDLGTIGMKPTATILKTIEVTGHLPRITMDGDTIVFNPEAYKLEDNARIIDLLRKLPGVTMHDDGSFYWNGKPIKLLLNGKDIFGGGALLTQLPAEAAQKLKLYDRRDKLARHTGVNNGEENNVIDIQVKPGFMDKFYGDVTAKYMTKDHYDGVLRATKLSDKHPFMVYADANSANRNRKAFANGWSDNDISDYGRAQYGAFAYQYNWQTQGAEDNNNVAFTPDFGHSDGWSTQYGSTQRYQPGEQQTFSLNKSKNYTHRLAPSFAFDGDIYTDSVNEVVMSANVEYTRERSTTENELARYDVNPYLYGDFPLSATLDAKEGSELYAHSLLRHRDQTSALVDKVTASTDATFDHYLAHDKGQTQVAAHAEYSFDKEQQQVLRHEDYPGQGTETGLSQYGRNPETNVKSYVATMLRYIFSPALLVKAKEMVGYNYNHNKLDFFADNQIPAMAGYRPTTADLANTMRSRLSTVYNTAEIELTYNITKRMHLTPALTWTWYHDHLDYTRGSLDTVAVRTDHLFHPQIKWLWKINRTQSMDVLAEYEDEQQSTVSTIDYADTRDPLNVTRGNPQLKNSGAYTASANYRHFFPRQQLMLLFNTTFTHKVRPVTSVMAYNSTTSSYTVMPANVKGGNKVETSIDYDQSFGPFFHVKNSANGSWERSYAYLTLENIGDALTRNAQRAFVFKDRLTLSYETDNWQSSLYGRLTARDYHYGLTPDFDSRPLSFYYGFSTRVKLGRLTLSGEIADDFNHGWLSSDMNRHRCLCIASAALKVLRNKGEIKIGMDDIFNQSNFYSSSNTAYERTESWRTTFSHYAYIGFTYHFSPEKKTKNEGTTVTFEE